MSLAYLVARYLKKHGMLGSLMVQSHFFRSLIQFFIVAPEVPELSRRNRKIIWAAQFSMIKCSRKESVAQ
jgi:hypothetical protein